ncbi:unnamed protein product [Rotaria socialis]|uniref:Uncharacterized protein n=1 Tax=Rotaria socialis TaxID=392032 RepID=A0A818G7Y2_9BILA|nr:unnamed protein product [Rotaria socialis]CAF3355470.1 unnamed protein product [Rotaria socialis]CAF3485800.1 unnamed protein product [Rotaria socialis]CAF4504840.1 unnamed protein product [Rotaria socialis]CAF4533934.1 unnamed protein product [Rotaria socialis]
MIATIPMIAASPNVDLISSSLISVALIPIATPIITVTRQAKTKHLVAKSKTRGVLSSLPAHVARHITEIQDRMQAIVTKALAARILMHVWDESKSDGQITFQY